MAVSPTTKDDMALDVRISFSNLGSSEALHRPCRNKGKEMRVTPREVKGRLVLSDIIASNTRKKVTSVSTNPTPLAALKRAIVLMAPTVKMLVVRQRTYIPIPQKMTTGSLAKMLVGR